MKPEETSQKLLEKARKDEDPSEIKEQMESLTEEELFHSLENDSKRKAFWINIYNAYSQLLLKEKPGRYRFKSLFFMRRYIKIAGQDMSMNKIENGYLRSSKLAFGFGYIKNPLARGFERKARVSEEDSRVHFALNCGAKTCPPVRFYSSEDIDEQLDEAAESYLNQEIKVSEQKLELPRLFLWYRGDFGGEKGVKQFLKQYGYKTDGKSIRYKDWNWELQLDNFKETR